MAVIEERVSLTEDTLGSMQKELRVSGLNGWLLYNFQGLNAIASGILGLPAMSRRYFVLIPAHGRPVALTHRIEQQPWEGWIGEKRVYLSWRELQSELSEMLRAGGRIAMEYVESDAVPYTDRVPAGVMEMVRASGVEVTTSADLVSAFHARWSEKGLENHRLAAAILRETVHGAFERIGASIRSGEKPTEWSIRQWIQGRLQERGLRVGADTIVAVNEHAANPHYGPTRDDHAEIRRGDLVLIDLWGKQSEAAIYADQTWMAWVGSEVPDRIQQIWLAARDAREAAVDLVRSRWEAGQRVFGYEVDDAARDVIRARGYGDAFIHRTGHSIDTSLHGSGPNIDNLETRDTRRLIPGIGFSIEPGIYLSGDVGFRTEIDVFMGPEGPEITTPDRQMEIVEIDC
ncbi:M24 family metallopeptidase [soil metagenome]